MSAGQKVSGCCLVGAAIAKRERGGRSRRASEDSAIGSEQEAEADLNLTAGIGKVAVGICGSAKHRRERAVHIQVETGSRVGASHQTIRGCNVIRGNPIPKCLGACHVGTIEQVEALTKHFKLVVFPEAEFLGDSEVDNLGSWKVEGVAADNVYALPSVRAVHSRTQSSGSVPGSGERKGQTILYLVDRSKFPAADEIVRPARGLPRGFRNGTENEAVGDVETGVAIFLMEIEWVQKVVGVRESAFVLAEIEGMRPRVVGIELQVAAHVAIHLDTHRVVLGVDGAEDLR